MFNCSSGFDVCDCDCHRHEGVMHCMPCCYPCPHCGRGIKTGLHKMHIESCEQERKELNEKLEKIIKRNISNG